MSLIPKVLQLFILFCIFMPIFTRSLTRSTQPVDLVTSLRDDASRPERLSAPRQGNAGVVIESGEGGPSTVTTMGIRQSTTFQLSSAKIDTCKDCPIS